MPGKERDVTILIRSYVMQKKKTKRKARTRNPYATSLNKAQYQKRIVPSKKKDIKPEIDYGREDI
jgi:hypothetical protein